ncbi:VanZ family protein [Nonomuraea soli]|uniref:Glycopeptide antibiotics resistance protein n=1 Tax=Nonomuraea soli TaxID=1032476 RepID=A0A7W0HQX7_9ACTN|nr:VanZ family protein [Nonomuraea soli]MBA2892419.1 glycopeptide antibiotics resistance protein [Nonomuraea soli]
MYETNLAIALIMAPFFIVLGALPFVSRQYARFGRVGLWSGLVAAALVLYACAVVAFTLFPLPEIDDPAQFCRAHAALAHPQLRPLASLDDIVYGADREQAFLQVFFNFVLFAPLGFFLKYRYGRGLTHSVVVGLALSLTVEFTQLTGNWGLYPCPYRLFDVDDLITNTAGTAIGWLLAVPLMKVLPSAWPRPRADLRPPGLVRRGLGDLLDFAVWWLAAAAASIVLAVFEIDSELAGDAMLYFIGFMCLLGLPLMRRDRSGPGRASLHLALAETGRAGPASRMRVFVRFLVFPLPFVVLFALEEPLWIGGLAVAHLIVALTGRSIAGRLSGTSTVTRAVVMGR